MRAVLDHAMFQQKLNALVRIHSKLGPGLVDDFRPINVTISLVGLCWGSCDECSSRENHVVLERCGRFLLQGGTFRDY